MLSDTENMDDEIARSLLELSKRTSKEANKHNEGIILGFKRLKSGKLLINYLLSD